MGDDVKAKLLAGNPDTATTDVVETWAGPVVLRGLTRGETFRLDKGRELGKLDVAAYERHMVSQCMVEPTMTVDDVAAWQEKDIAGGDLADVTDKISELSGLAKGADKSGVPGDGEQP